jgi:hypothetical protein
MSEKEMSPHADTPETMRELDEETREWLARLRPEDLTILELVIKYASFFMMLGRFGKWLLWGVIGLAIGIVAMGESIQKILSWFRA